MERGNGNMVVTLISERGDLVVHNYTVCVCVCYQSFGVCVSVTERGGEGVREMVMACKCYVSSTTTLTH